MVRMKDVWYLFFEVMNSKSGKGEIGLAISKDCRCMDIPEHRVERRISSVLPVCFQWNGDYYMIPESWYANSVRLYKAVEFPQRWSFVADLLAGNVRRCFHF